MGSQNTREVMIRGCRNLDEREEAYMRGRRVKGKMGHRNSYSDFGIQLVLKANLYMQVFYETELNLP